MCIISQETQFLVSLTHVAWTVLKYSALLKIQYLRRTLGNVRSYEMQQEAVVSNVQL